MKTGTDYCDEPFFQPLDLNINLSDPSKNLDSLPVPVFGLVKNKGHQIDFLL